MNAKPALFLLGLVATAGLGLCLTTSCVRAADSVAEGPQSKRLSGWYQWRGPEQTGVSREKDLPDKWSPPDDSNPKGENLLWTAPIGGMSSPIVFNGKLYTYTRDAEVSSGPPESLTLAPGPETQEALVCLDAKDGHPIWKHTAPMFQTDLPFHRLGWSNPVGDPTTGRVYGLGAQCDLVCLDGETGKVVWQHHMTEDYGLISTFGGRTPSPAIDEDQLFIGGVSFGWGDQARGQHRLFCFDKNTGQLRWMSGTGGLPVDAPYNTPVVAVINGERLVILAAGDGGIHAFQARTGKKVWSFQASVRGMNASVVVDGDYVYCGHDLDNPDTTELGRIYCLDAAHLEPGKPGAFGAGPPAPSPKEVWRFSGKPAGNGIEAGFSSPTIFGDRLYFEDDGATVWALDKKTGKLAWKQKCGRTGKASLTWGDGKLYVADGDGKFLVLKDAGQKAEVLSRTELPEKFGREYSIFGSVAIDEGRIFLETATQL
jgi:outer membrane protein assembly factor BamB